MLMLMRPVEADHKADRRENMELIERDLFVCAALACAASEFRFLQPMTVTM